MTTRVSTGRGWATSAPRWPNPGVVRASPWLFAVTLILMLATIAALRPAVRRRAVGLRLYERRLRRRAATSAGTSRR